jgi:hypothetical protein
MTKIEAASSRNIRNIGLYSRIAMGGNVILTHTPVQSRPDGMGDEMSLHAACAVTNGTKWAANKWVHNTPYTDM